jgi:tRNA-2-methylthio-N6-dimethylallyladenosine synthase
MITYFFRTYGCQANVADSQQLMQYLTEIGCSEVATEADADIVVVNTCAVREKAEQKLWTYLGQVCDLKRTKPYIKIGVIGCVASYKKKEIYQRFDAITFVYGAREEMPALQAYLTDLVVNLETTKQIFAINPRSTLLSTGQDRDVKKVVERKSLVLKPRLAGLTPFKKPAEKIMPALLEVGKSFINIMTGCNKACAYCIVPVTRGKEISYPMREIVERVRHDVANGAKEVTLIGQNVNSYIDPETNHTFPELLRQVAQIPGQFWVRYVSAHPQDMTVELFDVMAENRPKITGFVHFPVQSGSTKILTDMGRNYSIETYLEKVGWIRERMPDATISTDIIVGFPGETEEDFAATMDLLEKVRYDLVYSFIYSPRKYTRAVRLEDDCPADVKSERLELLQKRQMKIACEQNSLNIGKNLLCLVEKRLEHDKLLARTEGNVRVIFDGNDSLIGSFVDIYIEQAGPANMHGRLKVQEKFADMAA